MMRVLALTVLVAALAAGCSKSDEGSGSVPAPGASIAPKPEPAPEVANAPLDACAPATADGWCGVKFGMTPDEVKKAFLKPLSKYTGDAGAAADPNACFEMFAEEPIQGVSFLAEKNRVGRLDISSEGPKTADGFSVGTAVGDIRAKYGAALKEGPNKYEPEVTDLTVEQAPGKIVFEIQDGKVRAWRAGVPPTIDYAEHCG